MWNSPFASVSSTTERNPGSSRRQGWVGAGAGADVPRSSQRTIHSTAAPTFPSNSTTQCKKASLTPQIRNATDTSLTMKIPQAQTSGLQLACAEGQGEPRAPPLQPSWCTAEAGMRKEVSAAPDGVSLRLMQPQTDSGVSSIITPLSLWDLSRNEACFLPGAISFYPGWRLKADQWGQ